MPAPTDSYDVSTATPVTTLAAADRLLVMIDGSPDVPRTILYSSTLTEIAADIAVPASVTTALALKAPLAAPTFTPSIAVNSTDLSQAFSITAPDGGVLGPVLNSSASLPVRFTFTGTETTQINSNGVRATGVYILDNGGTNAVRFRINETNTAQRTLNLLLGDANRTLTLDANLTASAIQPLDATLTALAGVTTAANKLIYATGVDAFATTDLTTLGRNVIGSASAFAARAELGITSGNIPTDGTVISATTHTIDGDSLGKLLVFTSATDVTITLIKEIAQFQGAVCMALGTGDLIFVVETGEELNGTVNGTVTNNQKGVPVFTVVTANTDDESAEWYVGTDPAAVDLTTGVTGTLPVTNGGTGRATSTTAYGLLAAGTTATGVHQTLAAGATTELLVGGGASALPVWTTATGTGAPVRATSPTLVTPVLGVAAVTSINGLTITTSTGTLTVANGKTVSVSNTLTFAGTDGSTVTLGAGGTVLYSGGALGTPASGTVTNLTGTASININGTVGATTPAAGTFTTLTPLVVVQPSVALTDGATITLDASLGNKFHVTLGGNRTLAISNVADGQKVEVKVVQDGTGSRTLAYSGVTLKWAGGVAPTLTTTAGKFDLLGFSRTGSDYAAMYSLNH